LIHEIHARQKLIVCFDSTFPVPNLGSVNRSCELFFLLYCNVDQLFTLLNVVRKYLWLVQLQQPCTPQMFCSKRWKLMSQWNQLPRVGVTTCLVNIEMSENLTAIRELSGIDQKSGKCHGKSCQRNCLFLTSSFRLHRCLVYSCGLSITYF